MFDTILPAAQFDRGKPIKMKLSADQKACSALAERFNWMEVCSVETNLDIRKIADGAYLVSGQIEAAIIQRCRLSDNPVPESIIVDVEERFADLETIDETGAIDPMAVTVEAMKDGGIPLGEMIAQLVGLEASPWPRDPDAEENTILKSKDDDTHPFASLAHLKKNR